MTDICGLEIMKKKWKQAIIVSLLLLTLASAVVAQDQPLQPFVIAEIAMIHSKILGEDRSLFIYNPDKNGANLLPSYPVLYTLDENDMTLVTGLVKYLSAYNEQMSPMIVVGIDGGAARIRDLTPTHSLLDNLGHLDSSPDSWLKDSGGSERFTQFIREEVVPYVEQHYKAGPFRILAGHSVGGLEVIDCLLAHPEMLQLNVRNFPRSASVYQDLGECYRRKGKLQEAISAYGTALELDPNNAQIAQRLKELQDKK
jgi:enterochelin esterase-like enzyme